jgi:hypothetical protein
VQERHSFIDDLPSREAEVMNVPLCEDQHLPPDLRPEPLLQKLGMTHGVYTISLSTSFIDRLIGSI